MIAVRLDQGGRVRVRGEMLLPLTASAVWGQMRLFERFIAIDPFHARVTVHGSPSAGQAKLLLLHRFCGVRLLRVGRVLRWREGHGYSFSDLSARGPRSGFPHIFTYAVEPMSAGGSRLSITVRGRWTAAAIPRWAVRLWLWWVLGRTLDAVRDELMGLAWAQRAAGTIGRLT